MQKNSRNLQNFLKKYPENKKFLLRQNVAGRLLDYIIPPIIIQANAKLKKLKIITM